MSAYAMYHRLIHDHVCCFKRMSSICVIYNLLVDKWERGMSRISRTYVYCTCFRARARAWLVMTFKGRELKLRMGLV